MSNKQLTDDSAPAVKRELPADLGRRRMLHRSAGVATPIVMTLVSGPVSAQTCVVASSFVSLATFNSRNPTGTQCLSARGIEYWAALPNSDPDGRLLRQSNFGEFFPGGAPTSSVTTAYVFQTGGRSTLPSAHDLLNQPIATSGELAVVQLMIAAYMNARKGWLGPKITVPYLQGVWQNYVSTGGYKLPASGINWSEQDLITWLRVLMYPLPS
jgi:hypothetical protein